jgi:hypothetical protein
LRAPAAATQDRVVAWRRRIVEGLARLDNVSGPVGLIAGAIAGAGVGVAAAGIAGAWPLALLVLPAAWWLHRSARPSAAREPDNAVR